MNPAGALYTPWAAQKRVAPEIGDRDAASKATTSLPIRERLFLALPSWLGIRPGEIAALKIVDIRDGSIRIALQVYHGVIDSPKKGNSAREIYLESLADLLNGHVAMLPNTSPGARLFPSENGKSRSAPATSTSP